MKIHTILRKYISSPKRSVHIWHGNACNHEIYRNIGFSSSMKANVLFTDPPYCLLERKRVGGDKRDPKSIKKKVDDNVVVPRFNSVREYDDFTKQWMTACNDIALRKDAIMIVWTNVLGKDTIIKNAKLLDFKFLGECIWAKFSSQKLSTSHVLRSEVNLRVYESALVFSRSMNSINLSMTDQSPPWCVASGYHDNIAQCDTLPHPHPCHKPFAALEPLIRYWTHPGDLVLDPFSGSGAISHSVAKIGGRQVIGIEKEQYWVDFGNNLIDSNHSS